MVIYPDDMERPNRVLSLAGTQIDAASKLTDPKQIEYPSKVEPFYDITAQSPRSMAATLTKQSPALQFPGALKCKGDYCDMM